MLDFGQFLHGHWGMNRLFHQLYGLATTLGKEMALPAFPRQQESRRPQQHEYTKRSSEDSGTFDRTGTGAGGLMDTHVRSPRLKVTIRIDDHQEISRIEVHGVVTGANIRALYVVCRRVTAKLPGHEIVIDLAHARVSAAAIDQLREGARRSVLSSGIDTSETPCRLRIVDPPNILKIKEHV